MSTQIFVITHKSFTAPADPTYIPLHVGRANSTDLGYLADNTGDNISELNKYYVELTGLYWLWRNYEYDGNIGICHYRRYFIDDSGRLLKEEDYDRILSEYDIITSNSIEEEKEYIDYYGEAHFRKDIELEGEIIKKLYPEDYSAFEDVMHGKAHYFGNLSVCSKKLFDEYCEWLFSIFAEMGEYMDYSGYDDYQCRTFGFLAEQLLMVYVRARGLKVYEGKVGIFDEKAETKELKNAISFLIKERRIPEAKELFLGVLKARPDLALEHSDLSGEIPAIGSLIGRLDKEYSTGQIGLIDISDDFQSLIKYIQGETSSLLPNKNPILIYKSEEVCYNVPNFFAEEIGRELEKMGETVEYFDASIQPLEELISYANRNLKAVIGVQSYLFSLKLENGELLHNYFGAPLINIVLDHPCALGELLETSPEGMIILTHDRNYQKYIVDNYGNQFDVKICPPGGNVARSQMSETHIHAKGDYEYPLSFVGTYRDYRFWQNEVDSLEEKYPGKVNTLIELMKKNPNRTYEECFAEAFGASEPKLMTECKATYLYVMNYYRELIIQTILDAGLELHVFSDSWKNPIWSEYQNLHIHDAVSPEEVREIYAQSKLSLNIMSWHKDGMTERIADMMLNKTVAISDSSMYLKEEFDVDEIVLFDLEKMEELPEKINYILADDMLRSKIIEKAYEKASRLHTWEKRANKIDEIIDTWWENQIR